MKVTVLALLLASSLPGASGVSTALNTAANAVFDAAGAPNREATKVVPVVSAAGSVHGFAQVTGSAKAVAATAAVVEISSATTWSITAFVPVTSMPDASGAFHREYGVAVDALIQHSM